MASFSVRWARVKNPSIGMAARGFALAELILLPLSFITFAYVVVNAILGCLGLHIDEYLPVVISRCVLPVLIAAAIGYVTNWLAILMLFKPYEKKKWLFVWPQGLLPRNKAKMAKQIGHQVGTELLPPEALISEFEREVRTYLSCPEVLAKARDMVQTMLNKHEDDIVQILVPQVGSSVEYILEKFVTPEKIQSFWDETLKPKLNDSATRDFLATKIVDGIAVNAPELSKIIRTKLRAYLLAKIPIPSIVVSFAPDIKEIIIDFVMAFFADEQSIRMTLSEWLCERSTQDMLRDKLLIIGKEATKWLKSAQGQSRLQGFTSELKSKGRDYIAQYIRESMPRLVSEAFGSEKLWNWVEQTALPSAKDRLVAYIADNRDFLIHKLQLAERIETAINAQDMAHFHRMLNDLAAQHLSAIQVLGYILGGIVGGIQLLAR